MYRSLRVAFALLAIAACAVFAVPSVDTLASGSSTTTALVPQISEDNGHKLKYYQIWVPENASSVTIDFDVLTTPVDCSYLHVYQRSTALPCPVEFDENEFSCYTDSYNPENGVNGENTYVHTPYSFQIQWRTGTWWYIGVGRYYATDYAKACPYTLTATVTTCSGTQTATATSSADDAFVCVDTTTQTASGPTPFTTANQYYMARRMLPLNTGLVNVSVIAGTQGLSLYGHSAGGAAPTSYSYICSTSTSTEVGTNLYYYNMQCVTPLYDSYFYVLIAQNSAAALTGGIDIQTVVCTNSTGGDECRYPNGPLTAAPITPFQLSADDFPNDNAGSFRYFYVDVAPASVGGNISFVITTSVETGSGYIYWRRNGFVDENSNDGSNFYKSLDVGTQSYILTENDLYPGGRYTFAVQAYTGNLTVVLAPVAVTTGSTTGMPATTTGTGATGTTGQATGMSTASTASTAASTAATTGVTGAATTGEGESSSSASAVAVSFVAVVAAFAALF